MSTNTPTPLPVRTMAETPTPRTDAELYTVLRASLNGDRPDEYECVDPDFARTLEREVASLTAALAEARKALEEIADHEIVGPLDEWAESAAYACIKRLARAALSRTAKNGGSHD